MAMAMRQRLFMWRHPLITRLHAPFTTPHPHRCITHPHALFTTHLQRLITAAVMGTDTATATMGVTVVVGTVDPDLRLLNALLGSRLRVG